jgi:hypothetical protein
VHPENCVPCGTLTDPVEALCVAMPHMAPRARSAAQAQPLPILTHACRFFISCFCFCCNES